MAWYFSDLFGSFRIVSDLRSPLRHFVLLSWRRVSKSLWLCWHHPKRIPGNLGLVTLNFGSCAGPGPNNLLVFLRKSLGCHWDNIKTYQNQA